MRKGVKPAKSVVALFTSALVIATLAATCAWSYPNALDPRLTKDHNFVEDGFSGGGACDACHAAGGGATGDRLMRWGTAGVGTDADLCTTYCHDASNTLPPSTDSEWSGVTLAPPTYVHPTTAGAADCDFCHGGTAAATFCDCLSCHTDGVTDTYMGRTPAGTDWGTDTEVDKFFSAIGDTVMTGHLSDHNVVYTGTAEQLCSNVNNECLKCHAGADPLTPGVHPGLKVDSAMLFFPDYVAHPELVDGDVDSLTGDPILRPDRDSTISTPTKEQWENYYLKKRQYLCLACHDRTLDGGGALVDLQIGGGLGPLVPPTIYTADVTGVLPAPTFANEAANPPAVSFSPYEINGHGIASGIEGAGFPMNLTCMAEENTDALATDAGMGCHSAHGSRSVFNLEEGNFAAGTNTLEELGTNVCMSTNCHDMARVNTYDELTNNYHNMGSVDFSHARFNTNTTVVWTNTGSYMPVQDLGAYTAPNLLFFDDGATQDLNVADLAPWWSATRNFDNSVIGCVTCHDPHGTDNIYQSMDLSDDDDINATLFSTEGMLRRYRVEFDGPASLCNQCH